MPAPLHGVRVHLAGSVPDITDKNQSERIVTFVEKLCKAIFREGGSIIHGSHPSFNEVLRKAAIRNLEAGGAIDALTLVRAQKYAISKEHLEEINEQRKYALVQIIPSSTGGENESLALMRAWMAERCEAMVAVGGKWYDTSKPRAGIPLEINEAITQGKPIFVAAGFGGAAEGFLKDDASIVRKLKNGLNSDVNIKLAQDTNADSIVETIVSQLTLLPLSKPNISSGRNFRILALDGGGIRGAFTAAVLAKWESMLNKEGICLADHFDMIAGTSTGAILAIGLAAGKTPEQMLDFYKEKGPEIFPTRTSIRHFLKSKYDSETLKAILSKVLNDKNLNESRCRLTIPTVRAARGSAEVITTPHNPDRTAFREMPMVEAALASSAAPTYFDDAEYSGPIAVEKFLDGGIWANNPILPAIAETVRFLKIPIDRIDVLSIGTLGNEKDFTDSLGKGMAGWATTSTDLFFAAQEVAAIDIANGLLGHSKLLRVNQQTPYEIKLDGIEAINDMITRGNELAMDTFVHVRSRFLDGTRAAAWEKF